MKSTTPISYEDLHFLPYDAAILYAYLRSECISCDGWTAIGQDKIVRDIGMSITRQSKYLQILKANGKIEIKKRGHPPLRYIKVLGKR